MGEHGSVDFARLQRWSSLEKLLFDSPRASSLLRGLQFTSRILATQAKELWLVDANGI